MRRTLSTIVLALGLLFAAAPVADASVNEPWNWPDTMPFVTAPIPTGCFDMYSSAVDYFGQFNASLNWEEDQREALNTQLEDAQFGSDALERTVHSNVTRLHRLRHTVSRQRQEIRRLRAQVRALRADSAARTAHAG